MVEETADELKIRDMRQRIVELQDDNKRLTDQVIRLERRLHQAEADVGPVRDQLREVAKERDYWRSRVEALRDPNNVSGLELRLRRIDEKLEDMDSGLGALYARFEPSPPLWKRLWRRLRPHKTVPSLRGR